MAWLGWARFVVGARGVQARAGTGTRRLVVGLGMAGVGSGRIVVRLRHGAT